MSKVRDQINLILQGVLSPEATTARLASVARSTRDELIASGRASPKYTTTVDGQVGASEDTAHRIVVYDFAYIGDAVDFALGFLMTRAPTGPSKEGEHYKDCFMVAIDGRVVPAASFAASSVPPDAEILIYNRQPYGRKVDAQFVGLRRLKFSVPANLFADAARAVNSRFGNSARAERLYTIALPGAWITAAGRKVEYPALSIKRVG